VTDLAKEQLIASAKAVAALATHRRITPMLVHYVEHDREIRAVLDRIVRRWSKLVPVVYTTQAALKSAKGGTTIEHIVPCRVIVDRMIMRPTQIRRLLEECVLLARVTQAEHHRLGGIYTHHRKLYWWRLKSPIDKLPGQGRRRYQKAGVSLVKIRPGVE
jgi:hypothetical protein